VGTPSMNAVCKCLASSKVNITTEGQNITSLTKRDKT
jgi:hypothetical protein